MTSLKDVTCQKLRMVWQHFLKKDNFIVFKNFKYDQLFKGLKWQLSSKITETWLNDVSRWRHMSATGLMLKKKFRNIPLLTIYNMTNVLWKPSLWPYNGNKVVTLLEND